MRPKTWKREIALCGFAVWLAVTIRIFVFLPAEGVSEFEGIYDILTTMVWLIVGAVFSFHGVQDAISDRLRGKKSGYEDEE